MNNSSYYSDRMKVSGNDYDLRGIWEKRIQKQEEWLQQEQMRVDKSALNRLIKEWNQRLENKTKLMQKIHDDDKKKNKSVLSIEAPVQQVPSSA